VNTSIENGSVCVEWTDGSKSSFLGSWLRDHDPCAIHHTTKQRQSDSLSMVRSESGAACTPTEAWVEDASLPDSKVWVRWGAPMDLHDGSTQAPTVTGFEADWLDEYTRGGGHATDAHADSSFAAAERGPQLWGGMFGAPPTDDEIRAQALDADAFMADDAVLAEALRQLRVTGFCLVEGVEQTQSGTTAHIERIGHMRRTVYSDGIWDTAVRDPESDEIFDTAYTNMELKPHTDCTYYRDTPALQFFNCEQASTDTTGGQTVLVDGFAVAASLRRTDPDVFDFFSQTPLLFHCIEPNAHLEVLAPVFDVDARTGRLKQFRLNNDDRAPLHPHQHPDIDLDLFYRRYLPVLLERTRDLSMSAEVRLEPGMMLVINNLRVMHGRRAFEGSTRNMIGGYMNLDEYESRCRLLGIPSDISFDLSELDGAQ